MKNIWKVVLVSVLFVGSVVSSFVLVAFFIVDDLLRREVILSLLAVGLAWPLARVLMTVKKPLKYVIVAVGAVTAYWLMGAFVSPQSITRFGVQLLISSAMLFSFSFTWSVLDVLDRLARGPVQPDSQSE